MTIKLYIHINKAIVQLGLAAFIAMVAVGVVDDLFEERSCNCSAIEE